MSWTDERVGTLKKLWLDGLSASEIAKQLGGVSRCGVIGKVHRLGLSRGDGARVSMALGASLGARITNSRGPGLTAKPPAPKPAPKPPKDLGPPVDAAPLPERRESPGLATVMTIGAHMCKWPIGDPAADSFTFCGRRTTGTYCGEHARVAYQPSKPSKNHGGKDYERSLRRYL